MSVVGRRRGFLLGDKLKSHRERDKIKAVLERTKKLANKKLRRTRRREHKKRKEAQKMRVPKLIPEHVFVWPLGDTVPEGEKVKVICQVPPADKMAQAQRSFSEAVTNENTGLTRTEYRFENIHAIYHLCVLRIEGVEDDDGAKVDPVRAKEKLGFYVRVNFGLDEELHGVFQNDFGEWFQKKILRVREEAKKNLSDSENRATASGVGTLAKPLSLPSQNTPGSQSSAGPTTVAGAA